MKLNIHKLVLKLIIFFLIVFSSAIHAQLTLTGDQIICKGSIKDYMVDLRSGSTYAWTVINPANGLGVTTARITNNAPAANPSATNAITIDWGETPGGDYNVKVVETNTSCSGLPKIIKVTVRNKPSKVELIAPAICADGSASTIQAVVTSEYSASNYSYSWDVLPATVLPPGDTRQFTTKVAGTYTVTITDKFTKCSFKASAVLTINPLPIVTVRATTSSTICDGESATLNATATAVATGATITTYQWIKDGGDIPVTVTNNANKAIFKATEKGIYTVRVTDSNGCTKTSASPGIKVIVKIPPTVDLVDSSRNSVVGTTKETCQNTAVTLRAKAVTTPVALGIREYKWKKEGVAIPDSNSDTYTVDASVAETAKYTVEVTDNNLCHKESSFITVQVNPKPDSTILTTTPLIFCAGDHVDLNAKETGGGFTYQWFKDSVLILDGVGAPLTTSSYRATESGVYTLTVTDENHPLTNCPSSTPVTVTRTELPVTGDIRYD